VQREPRATEGPHHGSQERVRSGQLDVFSFITLLMRKGERYSNSDFELCISRSPIIGQVS
jgi:hypothetical protein